MQQLNAQSLNVTAPAPISYCELVSENKAEPSKLWQALDAIRPPDLNWAEWSRRANVSTSYFQDLKKGKTPSIDRLIRIVGVAGVPLSDFQEMLADSEGAPIRRIESSRTPYTASEDQYDVPKLGSAQGADFETTADGALVFAEQMDVYLDEIVDMAVRPPALRDRKSLYSLTVRGTSMRTKFEDGDPIYVDAEQRPVIGDIVIVQLIRRDAEGEGRVASVLIKELVKRAAEYVELEQYNPPLRFRVPIRDVHAIHRWVPWRETGWF